MPLTFSHPLAVLLLKNTPLNFTGLVLGSMAPDFLYFFQGSATGQFGHTLEGLFLVCIPMSIIFYLLFHFFLKRPIFDLLPESDRNFLAITLHHPSLTLRFWMILILSIAIGVGTHNFWDSFTHSYGYFVTRSELLNLHMFSLLGLQVTVYKFLQYSGHFVGVPLLILWYFYQHSHWSGRSITAIVSPWAKPLLIIVLYLLLVTVMAMGIAFLIPRRTSFIGTTVVWSVNTIIAHLLFFSGIWHVRQGVKGDLTL